MSDAMLQLRRIQGAGSINLRGNAADRVFLETAAKVLDQALPLTPNTIAMGERRVYWLGPDDWLIMGDVTGLPAMLEDALAGTHVAINDISGGNVVFQLIGAPARELLARGCTLDLHPRAFVTGDCAQSGLGKANVLIGLVADMPTFEIIVRRSLADYLVEWLQHAGSEYGIEFD